MGVIFSRFKKKRTAFQVLEDIESKISLIENFRQITEHRQKKIVGHLILYSVTLYIITAFIFYFYFFPAALRDRLFYIIPLLIFPIIVVILKRLVTWYYKRQIRRNEEMLSDLKAEKKQALDNVMEKETFKVAKEILLTFAPEQLKKIMPPMPPVPKIQPIKPVSEISPVKPVSRAVLPVQPLSRQVAPIGGINASNGASFPQKVQFTRPILPKERTNIDKLVEFLVGDGPNNRYALICKNCSSHNGMALKEEFLYIAFRCCYCGQMNPARKQRPQAPRLNMNSTNLEALKISELLSSEFETESNEETDKNGETEQNEEVLSYKDKDSDETNLEQNQENGDETTTRSSHDELKRDEEDTVEIGTMFETPEKSETEKKLD